MAISPSMDFLMSTGFEPMKIRTDLGIVTTAGAYSDEINARR
jgi:hypothetical protein